MVTIQKNPAEISPPVIQEKREIVDIEIDTLTGMINDPTCDFNVLHNQILKVIMYLHRIGFRGTKEFAMGQETIMRITMEEIQGTHKDKVAFTVTMVVGGATIVGGLFGIVGVIPGTMVGQKIAGAFPKILGFFSNAAAGKRTSDIGVAINNMAQGGGYFSKLIDTRIEGKRAALQFAQSHATRLKEANDAASTQARQQAHEAIEKAARAASVHHDAVSNMLRSTQA